MSRGDGVRQAVTALWTFDTMGMSKEKLQEGVGCEGRLPRGGMT